MSRWFLPELILFALLSIVLLKTAEAQTADSQKVRLMFYNVENLFDTSDDSLTEDNDFLPQGIMRWNYSRLNRKLNSLYKTIIAAGEWEPPAIVAMCEIENRKVLGNLIYDTYLSKFGYGIIHEDSPDRRGIDVCLIYRNKLVNILYHRYWIPGGKTARIFNSRSILYAKVLIANDTLHLILNHWPSRRGGVLAGEEIRYDIASLIAEKVDSINRGDPKGSKILLMGDFNCTPDDQVIRKMLASVNNGNTLVNLSDKISSNGSGTYRYQGTWEMIDQVIASEQLLDSGKGIYTAPGMLKVFRSDFLLKRDPKYPGLSPYSTYRGYKYQGGFSDHLPVLLDLKVR
jgi:endonuclease/exonuclease/phosphatase family metal-dependent hydrolase